jgi:glucose-6-phosphate dehydrogenase assembly protein OpcA
MATTIDPAHILKQLSELWTNLAHPDNGAGTENGVLRACAMTLIVAAEDEADAQVAGEALAELIHEHPSRAIVLKPSGGDLEARVFAQCWMPFGRRQQICCEEIEIAASPARLGDVPGLMHSLLAPDLPAVLWCRGGRWFAEPEFMQLLPLVDKLVVDSTRFSSTGAAFSLIGSLGKGPIVADLAWSRITGWREVIARAFDSNEDVERALATQTIVVTHGGSAPAATALYMGAWLSHVMPRAEVRFEAQPERSCGIVRVSLDQVSFDNPGDCTVVVKIGDSTHSAVLPQPGDCDAMREELGITGKDELYAAAFPIAARLQQAT